MKTSLLVLALALSADVASACSCVVVEGAKPTAMQLLRGADAVFTGTVLSIQELRIPAAASGVFSLRAVALELRQAWRGLRQPNAVLFAPAGEAAEPRGEGASLGVELT